MGTEAVAILTEFLLCYVDKAANVHTAYIEKLNIIRLMVYESKEINLFDKKMFIHDRTEKYKKAGMSNEIVWLLTIILVFLGLTIVGYLYSLCRFYIGDITMKLTSSAANILTVLLSLAIIALLY